jgi:hypothetical protein
MKMETPWYKSKTVLFNLATIAAGTVEQVAATGILGPAGPHVLQGIGVLGMILRALTATPLKF